MDAKINSNKLFTGTRAERLTIDTTKIEIGDRFAESDTGSLLTWFGTSWTMMTSYGYSLVADPWLHHSMDVITATYGDTVSIHEKNKDLLKFGHNELVGTSEATIQHQPAGILHETYVSTNAIDTIVSTNNGDTQNAVVEGHTISGGDFTFVSQTVTLTGQTEVTLGTPLARCTRLYNDNSTDFAGTISVFQGTDGSTTGIPTTAADVHLQTEPGENQSEKCSTTLSSVDYWIVTSFNGDCLEKAAAFAEIILQVRLQGKTFRHKHRISSGAGNGTSSHEFKPYLVVPPNSDIRLIATADGANTSVSGGIQGVLAKVI